MSPFSGKSGWLSSEPSFLCKLVNYINSLLGLFLSRPLQFSTFCNNAQFGRFSTFHFHIFQNPCHTHSFNSLAKYHVSHGNEESELPWQRTESCWSCSPRSPCSVNPPGCTSRRNSRLQTSPREHFSTCPILVREVSIQNLKFLNNSMEQASFEMERFSSG